MAVYVVLAFEDDTDAKIEVKELLAATDAVCSVRAVYKKPTKFCECKGNDKGWTRGTRFGWFVCARCGLPSRAWAKGDCWFTALGTNLLPVEVIANPEWRMPNWRSPDEWTFLLPKDQDAITEGA